MYYFKHLNYHAVSLKLLDLSTGEQPTDSEVEQLLQEIEKYTLANHLFWGIWGIISVSSLSHLIFSHYICHSRMGMAESL